MFFLQNLMNAIEVYSPPLSNLRDFISSLIFFSTDNWNSLNFFRVFDFFSQEINPCLSREIICECQEILHSV
jgi:hypothetical protein